MRRAAAKVAVSIPADLYDAVEKARKRTGKSRSAIMQDALRSWLARSEQAGLVREYEAGYRRRPEGKSEVKAAEAAAAQLLASMDR